MLKLILFQLSRFACYLIRQHFSDQFSAFPFATMVKWKFLNAFLCSSFRYFFLVLRLMVGKKRDNKENVMLTLGKCSETWVFNFSFVTHLTVRSNSKRLRHLLKNKVWSLNSTKVCTFWGLKINCRALNFRKLTL